MRKARKNYITELISMSFHGNILWGKLNGYNKTKKIRAKFLSPNTTSYVAAKTNKNIIGKIQIKQIFAPYNWFNSIKLSNYTYIINIL